MEGLAIGATDGTIGKVKNFYFDDQAWVVRYLVVRTTAWLGGREVLVSPYSLGQPNWVEKSLPANISKEQVEHSPSIDSDKPVSRRYEENYLSYYGYPYYWGGNALWGESYYPAATFSEGTTQEYNGYAGHLTSPVADDGDPHLRSCNTVEGYHIHAADGEIGHVDGFLVDDFTWSIRYIVVSTSNWWTGHRVLLSPEWIQSVDWAGSRVEIAIDRQSVKDAPVYDESAPLERDAELQTYNHYGRKIYWQQQRA